jgi:hypothetical protein
MADPQPQTFSDVQPIAQTFSDVTPIANAAPQGFWDKVKDALHPKQPLDMPGAKSFKEGSKELPGSSEGVNFAEALHDYDQASGGELGGGVVDIIHGNVARGLHRIISGASSAVTPLAPLAAPAMAAAPLATALSVGGGIGGAKVARAGAEAVGATPDQADLAADVGGFAGGYAGSKIPMVGGKALLLGKTPAEAYQSALKPSFAGPISKVKNIQNIVQTGLKNEIPVSKAGAEKLSDLIEDLQDKVSQEIGSGQGKTINPFKVASRLSDTANKFSTQVNPEADLSAISESGNEFLRNNNQPIPAAEAQAMKVGTYQQLKGKAYGELKSATIESQKALARGIKEELAAQFPELATLNAKEGSMYDLQPVLEKAIQRQSNHQIIGIGTPIAAGAAKAVTGSSGASAVVGALKAIVDNPIVKSRLAIALDKAGVSPVNANARIRSYVGGLTAAAANAEPSGNQESQQKQ